MNSWGSETDPKVSPLDIKRAVKVDGKVLAEEKRVCILSRLVVSDSVTPWTVAARLLCPWSLQARILEWVPSAREDPPNPGIEPASALLQVDPEPLRQKETVPAPSL